MRILVLKVGEIFFLISESKFVEKNVQFQSCVPGAVLVFGTHALT
jgi:hypothetical protein